MEQLPGAVRVDAREGGDEQDEPQDRESGARPEEHVVAPRQRALHQPPVNRTRAHRGRPPVEPVALGVGGMGAVAAAASAGGRRCRLQLPHVVDDGPAVGGEIHLVTVARHDPSAVANDAVDVPVAVRPGPAGQQRGRADPARHRALGVARQPVAGLAVGVVEGVARRFHLAGDHGHRRPARRGLPLGARREWILERVGRGHLAAGPVGRPVRLAARDGNGPLGRVAGHVGGLVGPDVAGRDHVIEPGDHVPEIVGRRNLVVVQIAAREGEREQCRPQGLTPLHAAPPPLRRSEAAAPAHRTARRRPARRSRSDRR